MTFLTDDAVARLRTIADEPDFGGTRYRLLRELARGGMGVVYEAEDLELQRRVAIKVLATELASRDSAERMRAEARVIAQLEHPRIVPLHDAGTLPDGRVFYVMKLVRGCTLADTHNLSVFLRVSEAVAFAHARGVIHCDLKPSNVMVGEFGEVLVMDWGVAKSIGERAPAIAGTRGFMPRASSSSGTRTSVPPFCTSIRAPTMSPATGVESGSLLRFRRMSSRSIPARRGCRTR